MDKLYNILIPEKTRATMAPTTLPPAASKVSITTTRGTATDNKTGTAPQYFVFIYSYFIRIGDKKKSHTKEKSAGLDICNQPGNMKWDPNRIFSQCGLENWQMTSRNKGNLFHAPKSYMCHLTAIHEFKLKLASRNAPIGTKSSIFRPMWPLNVMDDIEKL